MRSVMEWEGVTFLLWISHIQQTRLNTAKSTLTFKAARMGFNILSTTTVTSQILKISYRFSAFKYTYIYICVRNNFLCWNFYEWIPNSQPRGQNTKCYCSTNLASPRRTSSCCLSSLLPTSFPPFHSFPGRDLTCWYRRRSAASKAQQARSPAGLPDSAANSTWSPVSTSALYLQRRHFAYQKLSSFHTKAEPREEISQDFPSYFPITQAIWKWSLSPRPVLMHLLPSAPSTC